MTEMRSEEAPVLADVDVVQQCLEGSEEAINELKKNLTPFLTKVLASYGASKDEIDDILAQLWGDCLTGPRPLFHVFNGKSALKSWLTAISVNRWISLKRREAQHARAMRAPGHRRRKFAATRQIHVPSRFSYHRNPRSRFTPSLRCLRCGGVDLASTRPCVRSNSTRDCQSMEVA